MDFILNNIFTLHLSFVGAFFIAFGILYKYHPPRKINWNYGVKLPWTRRSQETWEETHRFVPVPMMIMGLLLIAIGLLPLFIEADHLFTLISANGVIIFSVLILLFWVEHHLNSLFDKQGRRMNNA
jgi:uncharacterized membrane protein